jgi:chaperonin cofactor prefoldin
MEKQFGMDCFALNILQVDYFDAYTSVIGTTFEVALDTNISNWIEGNKNTGYRWKKGNKFGIIINISYGILQNDIFTDGEILSVILHELGHNFADAIYDDIKIDNQNIMKYMFEVYVKNKIIAFGLMNPDYYRFSNKKKRDYIKKKKNIFRGLISGLKGSADSIGNFFVSFFGKLSGGGSARNYKIYLASLHGKDYYKNASLDRQNEVIADKFAGIYGYGPDIVSALTKMDRYKTAAERYARKVPIIGNVNTDDNIIEKLDMADFDEHPHEVQRAHEEIKLLKRELTKSDIDPKMKDIMEKQIKEINSILDECEKVAEDATKSDIARANYYTFLRGECPDAISDELEDKIEDAFDAVLNKGGNK